SADSQLGRVDRVRKAVDCALKRCTHRPERVRLRCDDEPERVHRCDDLIEGLGQTWQRFAQRLAAEIDDHARTFGLPLEITPASGTGMAAGPDPVANRMMAGISTPSAAGPVAPGAPSVMRHGAGSLPPLSTISPCRAMGMPFALTRSTFAALTSIRSTARITSSRISPD